MCVETVFGDPAGRAKTQEVYGSLCCRRNGTGLNEENILGKLICYRMSSEVPWLRHWVCARSQGSPCSGSTEREGCLV
jgi:hypothetical protein